VHQQHVVEAARERLALPPRALRRLLVLRLPEPVQVVVAEHRLGAELHQERHRARRVRALVAEVAGRQQPIAAERELHRIEQAPRPLAAAVDVTVADPAAHGVDWPASACPTHGGVDGCARRGGHNGPGRGPTTTS
jgi:hypothetical protein